ncbi:propanediol utilization protein [Escherichia coli]|nr:propanediol utilization protein [Escherichia coli]EER3194844.1 propanediol utilization protein [Escherichia coli]EER5974620.1 propanediol utilization protein [Escherichia coli]EEW0753729.1 propanediol utilization protein [Escherichia coli]EFG2955125.1 propanediol utilization protein [Escherichia coli]
MQRMMLIGPSQCGKTSLTQCLRGENIHYQKTQAIVWSPTTIDTPGFTSSMNRPVIGVVTKADLANMEQISLVKCWLREAGAHNVLVTSAVNNNGVAELFALLHTEEGCR